MLMLTWQRDAELKCSDKREKSPALEEKKTGH